MKNLCKYIFLGVVATVLCLGAFVGTSNAQRRGGVRFSISVGAPYRSYHPRYYGYVPRRVYRPARAYYYTPTPVYYSSYRSYAPSYYNSGYYAPAYNSGYYVSARRHRSRRHCNYYKRLRY